MSRRRTTRRRGESAHRARALPDAVEFVALAIRAGHSPIGAVRAARPYADRSLHPAIDEFERRLSRGAAFADALGAFADLIGASAQQFVDALATADRYGLPLGPVLDRLVDDAREQRRRQTELATRRLPVLLAVPLVTCTLPAFVLLAVVPAVLGAIGSLQRSLP